MWSLPCLSSKISRSYSLIMLIEVTELLSTCLYDFIFYSYYPISSSQNIFLEKFIFLVQWWPWCCLKCIEYRKEDVPFTWISQPKPSKNLWLGCDVLIHFDFLPGLILVKIHFASFDCLPKLIKNWKITLNSWLWP